MIAQLLALSILFNPVQVPPTNYTSSLVEGKPTVAILPILNVSGEKWQELKDNEVAKATSFLNEEFAARKFYVFPAAMMTKVIEDRKFDLQDEENWRRTEFIELGRTVGAKFVLFGAIIRTEQKHERAVEGITEIKMWFLDCETTEPIISAKHFVGRSGGTRLGTHKGSDRQIQAAANAFDLGLKEFFQKYPKAN